MTSKHHEGQKHSKTSASCKAHDTLLKGEVRAKLCKGRLFSKHGEFPSSHVVQRLHVHSSVGSGASVEETRMFDV